MALISSLASSARVPSGFMTGSPSAQLMGHQVKTSQPPQLPPKKVPWTSPPSLATARASAWNSPASWAAFSGRAGLPEQFLVVHPDREVHDERQPVLLAVPGGAVMSPWRCCRCEGQRVDRSVRSREQPLGRPVGHEHDVSREQVRQPLAAAAAPTLACSRPWHDRELDPGSGGSRCRPPRGPARAWVAARVHIVSGCRRRRPASRSSGRSTPRGWNRTVRPGWARRPSWMGWASSFRTPRPGRWRPPRRRRTGAWSSCSPPSAFQVARGSLG